MGRLDGKVAIVFGAGPNIGGTIAYYLAREGARVAVSDIAAAASGESAAFFRSRGFEAPALTADALDEADVASNVQRAVDTYGRLDIVVNMVGTIYWSS